MTMLAPRPAGTGVPSPVPWQPSFRCRGVPAHAGRCVPPVRSVRRDVVLETHLEGVGQVAVGAPGNPYESHRVAKMAVPQVGIAGQHAVRRNHHRQTKKAKPRAARLQSVSRRDGVHVIEQVAGGVSQKDGRWLGTQLKGGNRDFELLHEKERLPVVMPLGTVRKLPVPIAERLAFRGGAQADLHALVRMPEIGRADPGASNGTAEYLLGDAVRGGNKAVRDEKCCGRLQPARRSLQVGAERGRIGVHLCEHLFRHFPEAVGLRGWASVTVQAWRSAVSLEFPAQQVCWQSQYVAIATCFKTDHYGILHVVSLVTTIMEEGGVACNGARPRHVRAALTNNHGPATELEGAP